MREHHQSDYRPAGVVGAAVVLSLVVFLPMLADFLADGESVRLAAGWLGLGALRVPIYPLWGYLVILTRGNLLAMGMLSLVSAVASVALVCYVAQMFLGTAVARIRRKSKTSLRIHYRRVVDGAAFLTAVGFAVTPGYWMAATRVGPLAFSFVIPLLALALGMQVFRRGFGPQSNRFVTACGVLAGVGCWQGATAMAVSLLAFPLLFFAAVECDGWAEKPIRRWAKGFLIGFIAFPSLVYRDVLVSEQVFVAMAGAWRRMELPLMGVGAFAVLGIIPAAAVFNFIWTRRFEHRIAQYPFLSGWTLMLVLMVSIVLKVGWLEDGRIAYQLAERIVENSEGKSVVVTDDVFDGILPFLLPENTRVMSMSRDTDPEYGRDLAAWVKSGGLKLKGEITEDLLFAAELGVRSLLDEWSRIDAIGANDAVMTPANYFPTIDKWEEACALVKNMRHREPHGRRIRLLLGSTGVDFACRALVRGDRDAAWKLFMRVADEVDPENISALINLNDMLAKGYQASDGVKKLLAARLRNEQRRLNTLERVRRAVAASGRIHLDAETKARYQALLKGAKPAAQAVRLVEAIHEAAKDRESTYKARELLHQAFDDDAVRIESVSRLIISLDMTLGDRKSAEQDAFKVLRKNCRDAHANAIIGLLRAEEGDYAMAERYLLRAAARPDAPVAAFNDLAEVYSRTGRHAEALKMAEMAIGKDPLNWHCRQTQMEVAMRAGKLRLAEEAKAERDRLKPADTQQP